MKESIVVTSRDDKELNSKIKQQEQQRFEAVNVSISTTNGLQVIAVLMQRDVQ
jgi:hypothetical protein